MVSMGSPYTGGHGFLFQWWAWVPLSMAFYGGTGSAFYGGHGFRYFASTSKLVEHADQCRSAVCDNDALPFAFQLCSMGGAFHLQNAPINICALNVLTATWLNRQWQETYRNGLPDGTFKFWTP